MTIRVLVVDDQQLVRTGFRMILSAQEDLEVVGDAASGAEALVLTEERHPDVILMDIRMPGMDGLEATRRILADHPDGEVKIVILTTFDLDEYVYAALVLGATGFLLKDVPPDQLVAGVRMAHAGDALLAPSVTQRLIAEFTRRTSPSPRHLEIGRLSPREREVLRLVASGLSNSEVAEELVVGQSTVKTHVARVLDKLGVRDRVQAVIAAYDAGLVVPAPPVDRRGE
jgi:DNA-binding NarL/FixJ family response regulator